MKYKYLGKTGFKVSIIGFGGIPIQRVDKEYGKEMIYKAMELGINFIDTARAYRTSEEIIGYALKGIRDKWIVATKSMARDKETMKKDIETSLKNLQTDVIDLYQIHLVKTKEDLNKILSEDGALAALKEAKKEGKIKEIGITGHNKDILLEAIETGEFSTIQFPYNLVETQGEELFKKAYDMDLGTIAMKPFAGGAITDSNLALRFILENQYITCAIPGMDTVEQVIENAQIGFNPIPLNSQEKEQIREIIENLGQNFCRRCGYCIPCPQGIDIPTVFILEGYYLRYELKDWAIERYNNMPVKPDVCLECGICEKKCPYSLPIRDMLKRARTNLESKSK